MFLCSIDRLATVMTSFVAVLDDLKLRIPLEQASRVKDLGRQVEWTTEGIASQLREWQMKNLKTVSDSA
jgi:hypothetical protein